jgi:4-hydroxy-4-methyl-2-oxoglutarate aldolase
MKTLILISLLAFSLAGINGQNTNSSTSDDKILEMYAGLRVADVCDGMDIVGLRDVGILDQHIEPLWKDNDNFSHIIRGIAVTSRYVPTNKVIKNPMSENEFAEWESNWYGNISPEPFVTFLKKGSVIVLDVSGDGETGSVGSNNILMWKSKGAIGVVSNGGIRDIDEVIKEKVPVYLDFENRGRGIRPGRNEIESVNKPVTIGGVLIRSGDIIVADGDGVICVPREYAEQVAKVARKILEKDKAGRRSLYERMGMELDHTVLP